MFEFGREIRRALQGGAVRTPRDGLTGGDAALLDLLDLRMLRSEGRAADIAAGRVGVRDPAARQLEAARIWREVARRSGDPVVLRKAASLAQSAAATFERARRGPATAAARVEQAYCALLGSELFGDEGLEAAVAATLTAVKSQSGPVGALALAGLAGLTGRQALRSAAPSEALAAAAQFDPALQRLTAAGRDSSGYRLAAAEHRAVKADVMAGCGARLKDHTLVDAALAELKLAIASIDADFEPLLFARLTAQSGSIRSLRAELTGDAADAAGAVQGLTDALEALDRDQSPLDWTRLQAMLGQALRILGETTDSPRAFEQALRCFDRAALGLKEQPALALRAVAANQRSACLGRLAELTGDLAVLDAAEASLKTELLAARPTEDPMSWAIIQLSLARLYELRGEITGRSRDRLQASALAYDAALEVFAEQGLRSLTDLAASGLERIRCRSEGLRRSSAT
jgi:hypothetical protein